MSETTEAIAIRAHLDATKPLLIATLARLKATDATAHAAALAAIQKGATIRITTALSAAGLREVEVALVDVHGTIAVLAAADIQGAPIQ